MQLTCKKQRLINSPFYLFIFLNSLESKYHKAKQDRKDLFQCTKHELESVREQNIILEKERSELTELSVPEINMQGRGIVIANGKTYKCEVKRKFRTQIILKANLFDFRFLD